MHHHPHLLEAVALQRRARFTSDAVAHRRARLNMPAFTHVRRATSPAIVARLKRHERWLATP